MKPIIAPSILSADFGYLAKDIEMVNRSEAEWVHTVSYTHLTLPTTPYV